MSENHMSIGQLAKKANVSNRTLRYYEELGLITPHNRGENRYRYYDDAHVERISTIKILQESGFSLKEIVSAMGPLLNPLASLSVDARGQAVAERIYSALERQVEMLNRRKQEIDQMVSHLDQTKKRLKECFVCKAATNMHQCAECDCGPEEVTSLAKQWVQDQSEETKYGA